MPEPLEIRDQKHAAEVTRDLANLREAMKATKDLESSYVKALTKYMRQTREEAIEQEGFDTLILRTQPYAYDWDMMRMPDVDLQELRKLGLLTVKKGEYDEAVKRHGPLGLLERYARPRYSAQLRFVPPDLKRPRNR